MKPNLAVNIGSLKLKNPVMVASGTFGYGEEFRDYVNVNKLGALVTKTITRYPREGNPPPRAYETSCGMLNSVGLQNDGLDDFIQNKLKKYRGLKTHLIVSVGGRSNTEFCDMVRILSDYAQVSAFELNISCPNVKDERRAYSVERIDKNNKNYPLISQDPRATYEVVKAVRQVTKKTLIAKLSPNVCDITEIARAAQDAGADSVSLINTLLGMAIDVNKRKSVLGNVTGGLSGPAIKPIALRMAWQTRQTINLPIIGMGGILTAVDALEFIIAGASAVAVGSANFVNPQVSLDVIEGITAYLVEHHCKDVNELVGSLDA